MQSLKKKWLVISNMIWGTWSILTRSTTQKSKNLTLMGYFSPRYMKFELKKYRSYLEWHWTGIQNLNKPWPLAFKNGIRNWVSTHIRALINLKNCDLMDSFSPSIFCNVSVRTFQRNTVSWHRRVMQNFKDNWLVLKNDIGNLINFHARSYTLIRSFCPKHIKN